LSLRLGAAALSLVLAGGCAPSTPQTPAPSGGNVPTSSPTGQPAPPSEPVAAASSAAPSGVAAGLELAEVRFAPLPGEAPFVEIVNASSGPIGLAALSLGIAGTPLALAPAEGSLGPGERLLVVFDGPKDSEAHVVHAGGAQLGAAGSVQLLDAGGRALDVVAWGAGQPNAVALSAGDFASDTVAPGTTIGRPPGATDPYQPTEWVVYPPASATPGAPNPVPQVAVLLPVDGAILGAQATLSWYPVIGAATYRVQIAQDDAFAAPVIDITVSAPRIGIASLAAGRYTWHVQAIGADGGTSTVSDPSGFEVTAGIVRIAPAAFHPGMPAVAGPPTVDDPGKQLSVPMLYQRKDTAMLLLEEPHEHAPMAWDTPHDPPNGADPADAKNCAVAMVAMVNHFYGGDLNEDRIGYEVLKDRQPGPEEDLVFGKGLNIPQTNAAFKFALGSDVTFVPEYASYDEAWTTIKAAIDAGRPVPGANIKHGFVVTGYAVTNGKRIVTINDPARGVEHFDIDAVRLPATSLSLWLLPDGLKGTHQEPSVTTDSDGDGVVDFDETQRFQTDPHNADSDDDKVHDKQDIASGIFDPTYGYALHRVVGGQGRDFDQDSNPTEMDPDSDGGGCQDGEEDKNADGHRTGSETWNFDKADDSCFDLMGTITFDRVSMNDAGNGELSNATLHATIDVKLRADPADPTHLIDAGSSFTVSNKFSSERPNGSDCSPARHLSNSDGTYRFSDPPVPSPGHTMGELGGGDGHPDIWAYVDRQRGLMGISIIPYYPEKVEDTCQLITGVFGLPIVIDDWTCGSTFSGLNLSIDATIGEAPSGPLPVTVDCKQDGPAFLWQSQKVTTTGQLKLIGH
jgi:hypothetical protein